MLMSIWARTRTLLYILGPIAVILAAANINTPNKGIVDFSIFAITIIVGLTIRSIETRFPRKFIPKKTEIFFYYPVVTILTIIFLIAASWCVFIMLSYLVEFFFYLNPDILKEIRRR